MEKYARLADILKRGKKMFQSVSEDIIKKALVTYVAKNTRYLGKAEIDKKDDTVVLRAF